MWRVWFRTSPLQWCKSPLLSFMWLKRRPYGSHARSCGVPKKFTYTPGPVKPQRLQVQGRPPKCSWLLILGLGRERTLRNHPEGGKKKQKSINNLVLGESMRLCNHTTSRTLTHELLLISQSRCSRSRYVQISWLTRSTEWPLPFSFSCRHTAAPKASRLAMRPQLVVPSANMFSATRLINDISSKLSSKDSLLIIPAERKVEIKHKLEANVQKRSRLATSSFCC